MQFWATLAESANVIILKDIQHNPKRDIHLLFLIISLYLHEDGLELFTNISRYGKFADVNAYLKIMRWKWEKSEDRPLRGLESTSLRSVIFFKHVIRKHGKFAVSNVKICINFEMLVLVWIDS